MADLKLIGLALIAAGNVLAGNASAATPPSTPRGGTAKTTTAPETPSEPEEPEIPYEKVSELVVRISKEKGRDAVIGFLATFKNPANKKPATKGAEIDPKDYARAVEEATAILEAEDDVA